MNLRLVVLGLVAALVAVPAAAADDASGKWNASIDTPQGAFAFTFEFKAEGGKLTGSMSNEFMGSIPISEGSVKGGEIAFKLAIQGPDGPPLNISYKGVVKGDELSLTSTFEGTPPGGGPAETTFVATRAK